MVDPRARFATPERFPDAEEVIAAWPEEAFARIGGIDPATSIAVLTHDPKLDDAALAHRPALAGAVRRARWAPGGPRRLGASGCWRPGSAMRSSSGWRRPLGLDLGAVSAEETALSILAEVVAARHGRDGGRLASARGRIHEVPGRPRLGAEAELIGGLILAAGAGNPASGSEHKLLAELERAAAARACDPRPVRGAGAGPRGGGARGAGAAEVMARVEFGRAEPVVCPDWEARAGGVAALRDGRA